MRRILPIIVAICVVVSPLSAKTYGDFNDDGSINIVDLLEFVLHLRGSNNIPEIGHDMGEIIVDTVTFRDTIYLTENGQPLANEPLWGWWQGAMASDWQGTPDEWVIGFLQDNTFVLYLKHFDTGEFSGGMNEDYVYKYDSFTGLLSIYISSYSGWEPVSFDGDGFRWRDQIYTKIDTPPAGIP